ncbi:MAG: septum formation initiator family protein [Bacteroidales bacterium]|nr:septum formation initiator family protein [Bacteroidales bacterium]
MKNWKEKFGAVGQGKGLSFRTWVVASLVCFVVIAGFLSRNSLVRLVRTEYEILGQKREIARYRKQIEIMQDSIDLLKNDPEALEKYAREKHHFADSTEDVFLVK